MKFLSKNLPQGLEVFKLNEKTIYRPPFAYYLQALSRCLKDVQLSIQISNFTFKEKEFQDFILLGIVQNSPNVQIVDFTGCRGFDIAMLKNLLLLNDLKGLILEDCDFDDSNIDILIEIIISLKSLVHLSLSHNQISDKGIETLAPYLAAMPNLHYLFLKGNQHSYSAQSTISQHGFNGKLDPW